MWHYLVLPWASRASEYQSSSTVLRLTDVHRTFQKWADVTNLPRHRISSCCIIFPWSRGQVNGLSKVCTMNYRRRITNLWSWEWLWTDRFPPYIWRLQQAKPVHICFRRFRNGSPQCQHWTSCGHSYCSTYLCNKRNLHYHVKLRTMNSNFPKGHTEVATFLSRKRNLGKVSSLSKQMPKHGSVFSTTLSTVYSMSC